MTRHEVFVADQLVRPECYRDMMSAFPTGVAVVTATDQGGVPCGMTCSSLTSVTLTPPTLLVCLRTQSRTCDAVLASNAFALNLLQADARQTAELFSAPVGDRFGQVHWTPSPAGHPWLIDDAFAMAECRTAEAVEMSDHVVVFGEVTAVSQEAATPLLYGMRQFSHWCQQDHSAKGRDSW